MPPLLVVLPVIVIVVVVVVIVIVIVIVFMLVIVTVVWLWVWFRIWLRIRLGWLRLRFRIGRRRLRSGRWAGTRLRWRNSTGRIKKAATAAALRAFWRQWQDNTPIDVRGAGCQGQDQEKVFHFIHLFIISCSVEAKARALMLEDARTSKAGRGGTYWVGMEPFSSCCSRPLNSM